MSNYGYFISEISQIDLDKYVFNSFDKAKESGLSHSLVVIPDAEEEEFDVYLTAIVNETFGEYTCFVEQEFIDDVNLLVNLTDAVKNIYSKVESEEKRIQLEGVYGFYFSSYS